MKRSQIRLLLSVVVLLVLASSCGINSNVMFKTPKGSDYKYDSIPQRPLEDYRLSRDDRFTLFISTNYGQNMINQMSGIDDANGLKTQVNEVSMEYLIDSDGNVNLPIIGKFKAEGLTINAMEDTLALLYDEIGGYNNPYAKVEVTNQRVIVFPGDGGDAKVVPLTNNNTTLMEALAFAGGLATRGKANSIKLMRVVDGKRNVYLIDLSTIEGLQKADLIVQANDYIYVEPHERYGREIVAQITPFVSIIASLTILISILTN